MKVLVEIFFVKIQDEQILYRTKKLRLGEEKDPNQVVGEFAQHSSLFHSTSWRFQEPGEIILTYIAYGQSSLFGEAKSVSWAELSKSIPDKPTEISVVSHALRHLAFLAKNNSEIASKILPQDVATLEKIPGLLAGRI